ncbi:MAG TPA: hypothetical protein VN947_13420 [Polyangia bacterium]|nr:hypothetical protein [Polyangia bacterium]
MLPRAWLAPVIVALGSLAGVARAEPACVASLTAARDFAARLDSALDKLEVRVENKRTVVYGGECGRIEVDVHAEARGHADRPWHPEKRARRPSLLLDAGATLCGEPRVEERAHGGFVASLVTRAVPAAIVDRFKRAVDECVGARPITVAAKPKSAPRPDRRGARP